MESKRYDTVFGVIQRIIRYGGGIRLRGDDMLTQKCSDRSVFLAVAHVVHVWLATTECTVNVNTSLYFIWIDGCSSMRQH